MKRKIIISIVLIYIASYVFTEDKINEESIINIFNNTPFWEYATSELAENGYNFSVSNLVNNNQGTCWATRTNGGIGEAILLFFNNQFFPSYRNINSDYKFDWQGGINILNGFAKSKRLYEENNRAKDIEIKLYKMYLDMPAYGHPKGSMAITTIPLILLERTNLVLKDEYLSDNKIYFSTNLELDAKSSTDAIRHLK